MPNYEKKILRNVGKAIADYKMIEENDNIMICLSGGKDSWTLLNVLNILKKRAPVNFSIFALKIDVDDSEENFNNRIKGFCNRIDVPIFIIKTNIKEIISENNKEKGSYCAFCARLRRGFIYTHAKDKKATKIALGHHREDFNETLLMNMFFTGQIKSMPAKYKSDDGQHTIIRPLIYVSENHIIDYSKKIGFPISVHSCLYADSNERSRIKGLIDNLEKQYPEIKNSLFASQSNIVKSNLPFK